MQDVESARGRGRSRHLLWLCLTWDTVCLRILPALGHDGGLRPLEACGVLRRILPGDGALAYCRAHQRHDFCRVGTGYLSLRPRADAWIERIGFLFRLAGRHRDA